MSDISQNYTPPFLFRNAHIQTIYPTLFRKVKGINYYRRRIATPDDDFLDLDWSFAADFNPDQKNPESKNLVIISHGLEGNTSRHYVKGTVKTFNLAGWDAVAWNFRGCSGEPNNKPQFYHSGASYDLRTVINFILHKTDYESITLVGYSMGGNITLKYLGEESDEVHPRIKNAVTISVPCDLSTAAEQLARPRCKIYMSYFLRKLHKKIQAKKHRFPDLMDDSDFHKIKTFADFDSKYTAPLHGFESAEDYWNKASCKPYLNHIRIPALLINSSDDPFMSEECFPHDEEKNNNYFTMLRTNYGGHVGFMSLKNVFYWSERQALDWAKNKSRNT